MNIYKYLPEEIKFKIDLLIQNNIKIYVNEYIFKELDIFHKNRLKKLFFNYYYKMNQIYGKILEVDNYCILRDILFYMNHPFSQNMDTPFLSGRFSIKFINIMKRINKHIIKIIDKWYNDYYSNSFYDDYQLEEKFISMLKNQYYLRKSKCIPFGKSFQEKNKITLSFIYDILDNLSIIELEKLYIYKMKEIGHLKKKYIIENTLNFNYCQFSSV